MEMTSLSVCYHLTTIQQIKGLYTIEDETKHPNCLILFDFWDQKLNSWFCQPSFSSCVTSLREAQGQLLHTLNFSLTNKSSEDFANYN